MNDIVCVNVVENELIVVSRASYLLFKKSGHVFFNNSLKIS